MQKRNQSRTAFVNEAQFLFDKGADLALERGSVAPTKAFNASSCSALKKLALPPRRSWSALDPTLLKQFEPATDRVVVQQKRIGDFLTAPPVVQKHQGIPRRVTRKATDPSRANAISLCDPLR